MKAKLLLGLLLAGFIASCTPSSGGRAGSGESPSRSGYPETPWTVTGESQLLAGPLARGRVGDVLLANDKIRVVVQKPGKSAGLGSFGGTIIDADLVGGSGDQFGELFPLVNIEWTVNYLSFEAITDEKNPGRKMLRAYGRVDAYDYLDIDFISEAAAGLVGQKLSFANRFDDRRDPFEIYDDLKGLNTEVVTDYILDPGKSYVEIKTTFQNSGSKEVRMPVGAFMNGSGQVSVLIPGIGFTPDTAAQVAGYTPAIIYAGYDGVPVSYGFFYDPREFPDVQKKNDPQLTTSITYGGFTGVIFGETFLKLLPLGSTTPPEIHFAIPAESSRTVTSYFVVGDGSAGSVLDTALEALRINTRPITGTVVDGSGNAVENAVVSVKNRGGGTVTQFRTSRSGGFTGTLSAGDDAVAKTLGKGEYIVLVDKSGFHANTTAKAGLCTPEEIDLKKNDAVYVRCVIGETATVVLPKAVVESASKQPIAARLTIVGMDPSPNVEGSAGVFSDNDILYRPYGIVDVKYIAANGTFGFTGMSRFQLEPGTYRFVFSHGPEYTVEERLVELAAGDTKTLDPVSITRVVFTPDFISTDCHVHAIPSPDSSIPLQNRVLTASAEGLDILQSTDHDYHTNYAPIVSDVESRGLIPANQLATVVGVEITPNQYGHIQAYPAHYDANDVSGGALDWTASDRDEVSTAPDYAMSPDEIMAAVRSDGREHVLQINHIADSPTGMPVASGWVTTTAYEHDFGVPPLSAYGDPIERRLLADGMATAFPRPLGTDALLTTKMTAVELTIGQHHFNTDSLYRSALPTWFNLLNLGLTPTATANSDSHMEIKEILGMPRNYVASSVDPRDGKGTAADFDLDEYARGINAGKVVISAGPYLSVKAKTADGQEYGLGETAISGEIELVITAEAPSWAWFDTIEVFANTDPVPIDDVTGEIMTGSAADPAKFYQPYHIPKYTYQPTKSFRVASGTLPTWKEEKGKITATVSVKLSLAEDTWLVVMARGTRETEGYRSLFPIITNVLLDPSKTPEQFDPADLASFHADSKVGAPVWGLTNPIYVDVDGDGFKAKYAR